MSVTAFTFILPLLYAESVRYVFHYILKMQNIKRCRLPDNSLLGR